MSENKARDQRLKAWLFVVLWVFCIYSTLYIVRPICEFLKTNMSFPLVINIGLFILLFGSIFLFIKNTVIQKKSTYALIFLLVLIYLAGFMILEIPEEKIHFIEYGVLAFLVFRAVSIDYKGFKAYGLAFVITSLLGWGDEGIQYLLPNRYYQLKDVLLNSMSGAMGLFFTFVIHRERQRP